MTSISVKLYGETKVMDLQMTFRRMNNVFVYKSTNPNRRDYTQLLIETARGKARASSQFFINVP